MWVAGWLFSGLLTLLTPELIPRGLVRAVDSQPSVLLGIVYGLFLYLAVMVRRRFDCQILSTRASVYRWLLLLYPLWIIPALFMLVSVILKCFPLYEALLLQWQRFLDNDPW